MNIGKEFDDRMHIKRTIHLCDQLNRIEKKLDNLIKQTSAKGKVKK